ncbi:MAG: hypothetical protein [Podoviridae sp. ctviO18]|nr:MAG: hypothetical protein [Podoviridae sp. ctviO18]
MTKLFPTASALVALAVAFVALFSGSSSVVAPTPTPLEAGGTVENVRVNFTDGINVNAFGGNYVDYASGSVTFTAKDICNNVLITQSGILNTAVASAQTNTLPSASSLINLCLKDRGDSRTVRFENQSLIGYGRFVYTFQLGSGMDVFVASTSGGPINTTSNRKLRPEEAGLVRFTNLNGSSVSVDFLKMVNGD